MDDDEIGFNMGSLRSALRKVGRNINLAANPVAQLNALRGGGRRRGGRGGGGGGIVRVADPTEMRSAQLAQPGAALGRRFRGARMAPVGMPTFTFVNAGATTIQQSIQPQSALSVRKLVISVARIGTTAQTQRVTLAQVLCGSDNQLPVVPGAASGVDVALFGSDVNDNEVSWAPVQVGQLLTIQLALTGVALGVGDSIVVAISMNALTAS